MKTLNSIFSLLFILAFMVPSQAQVNLRRIKNTADREVEYNINRGVRKGINNAFSSIGKKKSTTKNNENMSTNNQGQSAHHSNSSTSGAINGNPQQPTAEETSTQEERHFYVSRNTGRGRIASKEQPAKDLGNIIANLQAGDVIHIAEGVYTSRGDCGSDIINVPVKIIGGYSTDFSKRDPWGAHKTILTGVNTLEGETTPRLKIETDKKFRSYEGEVVVDGIIVDNGPRNRYKTDKELLIIRMANMNNNQNPTPGSAGIDVRVGKFTKVTVRNCLITNAAPSQGVLNVQAGENGEVLIENNAVINNTGNGIQCMTNWHSSSGQPKFTVINNTVLFSWKHDAVASYGGAGLAMDRDVQVFAANNVFGFGDFGGVDNAKLCRQITLKDNLLTGNKKYDYMEGVPMAIEDVEDESDYISYESVGNVRGQVQVPVNPQWAEIYASRVEISRAMVDAQAKAYDSDANELRSMLGLPLQANTVTLDAEVWLHRMQLEDAIKAGMKPYKGKYGSSDPKELVN